MSEKKLLQKMLFYLLPYKWYLSLAVLSLFLAKVIEAYVPLYLGAIVESIIYAESVEMGPIQTSCLWALLLVFVGYLLDATSVFIKSWISQEGLFHLRSDVYDHIQKLPTVHFDRNPVGKLMTRTIHDIDQINLMFSESVVPLISSLILFMSIGVAIFFVNWQVALAICVVFPLALWLTNDFRLKQRKCYVKIRKIVGAMNGFVQEHLMGVSTIRSFGLEKKEEGRFDEINQNHCNAYLETIRHFAFFFASIDFLRSLALVLVFVVLTYAVDGFDAATFFTFSLYTLMIFRPLYDLAERYNVLQSAMAAAERVFATLEEPIEEEEGITLDEIDTIAFEDVWFAYRDEEWVLKGISFFLSKGESLALVGMTGSGKTSILNLLLRLYPFQKGSIVINGRPIGAYSLSSLRGQFSAVLQDPVIFSGTIEENISLGDSSVDVGAAIDYVNLHDILRRLPEAKSLSVGEMQLVSLARAVAHSRSVIVLDEATANIDSATEKLIQSALNKLFSERTILVVAHRLSTSKHVDRILVIHNGLLLESGSHKELLAAGGAYEKLYRLQF